MTKKLYLIMQTSHVYSGSTVYSMYGKIDSSHTFIHHTFWMYFLFSSLSNYPVYAMSTFYVDKFQHEKKR